MKKVYILAVALGTGMISCTKEKLSTDLQCMQLPPVWCATVRCNPDGKPVCGCDKITYGSACEAECAGITSYTYGACR